MQLYLINSLIQNPLHGRKANLDMKIKPDFHVAISNRTSVATNVSIKLSQGRSTIRDGKVEPNSILMLPLQR